MAGIHVWSGPCEAARTTHEWIFEIAFSPHRVLPSQIMKMRRSAQKVQYQFGHQNISLICKRRYEMISIRLNTILPTQIIPNRGKKETVQVCQELSISKLCRHPHAQKASTRTQS
jgi:hypothetical protein